MQQQIETNETETEVVANETNVGKNTPDVLEIGKRAVQDWKNGDGAIARGQQRAIYCVALAWNTIDFHAVIESKKTGAVEEQWYFDLEEYMNSEPKKADGTRDNKKSQAQHVSVFRSLFGIDEPTGNQKTRIKSALQVVDYMYNTLGYDESDLIWDEKHNRLEVPFVALEDEPDEKADEEKKKTYKAMKGETVALTGKKGRAVADLERRARPKREDSGASSTAPDKGKALLASIVMCETALKNLLDEKAKSDYPAPNKDMRKHMWELSEVLTRYFEADPMDKEEEKKEEEQTPTRKRVVNTRASKG